MNVLTVEEMKLFDQNTLVELDMPETDLMFRAGYRLVKDFLQRAKPGSHKKITVIAGIGNNGGDAIVMALELLKLGYLVEVMVVGDLAHAGDSFLYYYNQLRQALNITTNEDIATKLDCVKQSSIIIDGLFGVGLSKPISGYRMDLIEAVNRCRKTVYSIDIPSGLHPMQGIPFPVAIKATYTGVIANLKLGNLLNDALDYHGEWTVLDIGIIQKYVVNRVYIEVEKTKILWPHIPHNINKYTKGLGVFIGGRNSMMGSIQMSAISSMKSGLGIAYVFSRINKPFTQFYPEIIIDDVNSAAFHTLLDRKPVVVFGPGMESQDQEYQTLLKRLIHRNIPMVIDATGLEYLDLNQDFHEHRIIVTPHVGEMAKLMQVSKEEVQSDPLRYIKKLTDNGLYVLLKGQTTIIASDRETAFLQANNPGLATAGSGDVLAGIVAAFLANNEPYEAMMNGVVLHSRAGQKARDKYGIVSMTASNIIEMLPDISKEDYHV